MIISTALMMVVIMMPMIAIDTAGRDALQGVPLSWPARYPASDRRA
jgi:hypothetical protein